MNLSAIVLAGGLAERMGGDKPLRTLRGKSLLHHAIDRVAPLSHEVIVSTGAHDLPLPAGVRGVPDPEDMRGRGPLVGIHECLKAARERFCLLVPCDLPNLTHDLLQGLIDEIGDHDAVHCRIHGEDEPLVAVLRREPAEVATRRAIQLRMLKVVPCWQKLNARVLEYDWLKLYGDPRRLFSNINTPEDLAREEVG